MGSIITSPSDSCEHVTIKSKVGVSRALAKNALLQIPTDAAVIDDIVSSLTHPDLRQEPLLAIWVVSKSIRGGLGGGKFNHWALKAQSRDFLLTVDFVEKDGVAIVRLDPKNASLEAFPTFFHTYDIISAVVPPGIEKNDNCAAICDAYNATDEEYKAIDCETTVADIGDAIAEWSADHTKYTATIDNCQKFVYDLYKQLLKGEYFPAKLSELADQLQSDANCVDAKDEIKVRLNQRFQST